MRIIAGRWKGRPLKAPKGTQTRPTSDRVRESLFNILGPIERSTILDLFSGTGAIALEAISRGAAFAVCVERDRRAIATLTQNVTQLQAEAQVAIHPEDVQRFLPASAYQDRPFDVIFADPPWKLAQGFIETYPDVLVRRLAEGGRLILERDKRDKPPPALPGLDGPEIRAYGDTLLAIYRKA